MMNLDPVFPLYWDRDLAYAAKDHVKDSGQKGLVGHTSSSGLDTYDRLMMNCDNKLIGMWAENLVYEVSTGIEIVVLMLLDDGEPSRRSRLHALDRTH